MGIAIILISVSILIAILVYIKHQRPAHQAPSPPVKQIKKSWAYKIVTPNADELSCAQVKLIRDRAIPVQSPADLPHLPLAKCDLKTCRCRLEPLPERRSGKDRRFNEDRRGEIRYQDHNDRRQHKDRRKGNAIWSDRFGKR